MPVSIEKTKLSDIVEKIKVLIVDDSSIMRKLISKIITDDPSFEVVDTAMNGLFALKKIKKFSPDIVLCDLEMPGMDGIEFLKMRNSLDITTPVIVISSLGKSKPEIIFRTIELGACDFIIKPSGSISMDIEVLAEEIRSKIRYYHKKNTITPKQKEIIEAEELKHAEQLLKETDKRSVAIGQAIPRVIENKLSLDEKIKSIRKLKVLAIGISTGGPNALRTILPCFPQNFPLPILIVQHMPPGFTKEFANGLNDICKMKVQEAADGLIAEPGNIYISPGDFHLMIDNEGSRIRLKLDSSPQFDGHRPSVGMLFKSVLTCFGNESINVIMTGMGKDGAFYISELSKNGAIALAQSEASCVVFGMPKVAIEMGGIDEIISLDNLPQRIMELVRLIGT